MPEHTASIAAASRPSAATSAAAACRFKGFLVASMNLRPVMGMTGKRERKRETDRDREQRAETQE